MSYGDCHSPNFGAEQMLACDRGGPTSDIDIPTPRYVITSNRREFYRTSIHSKWIHHLKFVFIQHSQLFYAYFENSNHQKGAAESKP